MIAPKRVAEHVWPVEAKIWRPDLRVEVAAGSASARRAALRSDADVVVLGRDNVADAVPVRDRFSTVVLDELSSFKNRATLRWRHARKLCESASYVWGLTGTPSPNGYMDLWAELALVDLGHRLGRSITRYRAQYFVPSGYVAGGVVTGYELRNGAQARIDERLADICVSMRSEDYLELPATVSTTVEVSMPRRASKAYEEIRRDLVTQLDSGETITAASAAVATGKLSQVTAGFLYEDDNGVGPRRAEELHRSKVEAVVELVDNVEGGGALVFYRFRQELAMLREALPGARTVDEAGVIEDWNNGAVPVLLAHPASAGHGLNLQAGGHTVIWSSPTWSLESYLQANARLARQGQSRPVMVHHVVVPGTVDAAILAALDGRRSVQDALMVALGIV